ncbi:hypothetical protein TNCT_123321 [Trichonephila clavata]|uniref:Uncharacterized protein n=1 Tax=Trichonephila clavata TaxID=2740835 RepID=A0A8X6L224_TRICU|nr:hypothetical protein TNCT_123321 [Trichonephila clavata]
MWDYPVKTEIDLEDHGDSPLTGTGQRLIEYWTCCSLSGAGFLLLQQFPIMHQSGWIFKFQSGTHSVWGSV